MTNKWITIRLKGRTIKLEGLVFLHCDLIGQLHERMVQKGLLIDIDYLFDNVITKG